MDPYVILYTAVFVLLFLQHREVMRDVGFGPDRAQGVTMSRFVALECQGLDPKPQIQMV